MSQLNFDATNIDPSTGDFEPMPNGYYVACVIESIIAKTKAGTGDILTLTWEILDGQFKSRRVWSRLNIANPNKDAEEIAARELSAICYAVNVIKLNDSNQLHRIPCEIKLKTKHDAGYDPRNEICDYRLLGAAQNNPANSQTPVPAVGMDQNTNSYYQNVVAPANSPAPVNDPQYGGGEHQSAPPQNTNYYGNR